MMVRFARGIALVVALGLQACTATSTPVASAPPPTASGAAASGFQLPNGTGCAGEVARFRAVLANDLPTGHVGSGVHDRAMREVDAAAAACSGGREAEAVRLVRATKGRYGYI